MMLSNTQLASTVLVIDDQETLLTVVLDMLTAKGMNVLTARSGREGIRVFQENAQTIDVVLLDMKMPDLNGDEVFAELEALDPKVRVIITTGYEEREALARFNGQQKVAFIQKPYRFKILVEMIAAILAEKHVV
ncbi:MAG: response regulator [Ardenticatenaceae bacterium]|nr:response regulator [Ardenticatenaceae bacterium]